MLDCMVGIARHHGIELAVERLRHTYAIADGPIPHALQLRIAREVGLRARVRLTWDKLARLGLAYPALANLTNRNWVIVAGVGKNAAGEEAIEALDPLAERAEPRVVTKAAFGSSWVAKSSL
jgi:ATP-binding cassette, subfamily B, bacterial HlyB/CyaB